MAKVKYKLAIVFAALLLVGGGLFAYFHYYAPLTPEEPVELEIWYAKDTAYGNFESLVKRFNKDDGRYRQVSASVSCFDDEKLLLQKVSEAVKTGELPDAIICDTDILAYLQSEKKLADIELYITDISTAGYEEELLKACSNKGALMCVPIMYEMDMLIVNQELYGNIRSAHSFEELCDTANSYYTENGKAFFTVTDYSALFRAAMLQLGEEFTAENPFDSDSENLRYIYDCLATAAFKRGFTATADNPALLVSEGELPCAVVSSTQLAAAAESIDFSSVELVPVPAMEAGEKIYIRDVVGISILKSNENSEKGAALFAKWLSSEEISRELTQNSGYAPTLEGNETADTEEASACQEAIMRIIKSVKFRDYYPSSDYAANSYEFNGIIDNIMKKSLS